MFLNFKVFILSFFLIFSFFSFAGFCEDSFRFPHSKLYSMARVIKSGIIEKSKRLFPTSTDPVKDRALVKEWNEEAEAPKLFKRLLPEDVYFIKHQQYQPGTPTSVKIRQPGDEIMARASWNFEGREIHTNVVFSKRALHSNINSEKNWLVGTDARAAYLFFHGGGTNTTGASVASGQVSNLKRYKVDMVSIDLPWHAQGSREFLDFESEIRSIAALVQKYIPPHVPLIVGGHSLGGVFAEQLMMMTDRPRDQFFFHESLQAALIFSTAVDAAPGRPSEVKKKEHRLRIDEVNHNRQDEAAPEEVNLWKMITIRGKFGILASWYSSGIIFQFDQSLPAHKGRDYINAYVAVGGSDPLVRIGFEDLYDARYNSLENVTYTVLDLLPSKDTKPGEPLNLVKVGHLLGEYKTADGKEQNVMYALTRDYIGLELSKYAVKKMKELIFERLQSSSLDVTVQERISEDVKRLSSLEEINLFLYTNTAIQGLETASLGFLKKSIIEKADYYFLSTGTAIGDPVKHIIRQQLGLSSLSASAKQDVAESVNRITSFEELRNFVADKSDNNRRNRRLSVDRIESINNSIKKFIEAWDPSFSEAINALITRKLEEHSQASLDKGFVDTIQYFANDLGFREYQQGYTYYKYDGGNAQKIKDRDLKILKIIGNIVDPYYNPQVRATRLLAEIRELDRVTAERMRALRAEIGYVTTSENLKRIHRKGGEALVDLQTHMGNGHPMDLLVDQANKIMGMRTVQGDLVFNTSNGEQLEGVMMKRTRDFIKSIRAGEKQKVKRLVDELGLSAEDKERLNLLFKELEFNKNIAAGYFPFSLESLLENVPPENRERVTTHYDRLRIISREWEALRKRKMKYNKIEVDLLKTHKKLLQKIEGSIKTIREAFNDIFESPPESLKDDQPRLNDSSEKLVSVADELINALDNRAVQIFQQRVFNPKEVEDILKGEEATISYFIRLYEEYTQQQNDFNRMAIIAMEAGEMENGVLSKRRSLQEVVTSLYGEGLRGKDPVLSERYEIDINQSIEKIKAATETMKEGASNEGEKLLREAVTSFYERIYQEIGQDPNLTHIRLARERGIDKTVGEIKSLKEVSELKLKGIQLKLHAIEKVSEYLAFQYLIIQLAKVEMEQYEIERASKMNRSDYVEEIDHLQNLITSDLNPYIQGLIRISHEMFKPEETRFKNIISRSLEDLDKQEVVEYVRAHRSIFESLTNRWGSSKSALPPFLPTVYQ